MAKDSDPLADALGAENTRGLFSSLLAEEAAFDRRTLWRLGSWGVATVGAVVAAVMANQAQFGWRRDQVAAADLAQQAQQIQALTRETQNEARRLASAIETLNTDRDRLYSRVTVVEQGLDSVTGAIVRQGTAATPPAAPSAPAALRPHPASSDPVLAAPPQPAPQAAAPAVAPVASAPAAPGEKTRAEAAHPEQVPAAPAPVASAASASLALVASKSILSPPDPAAPTLVQPEKTAQPKAGETPPPREALALIVAREPEAAEADMPRIPAQRTEFAVDLGSANSIGGLRALWRGLIKADSDLAALRPIIMVRESNTGFGMQLRLGAGPLNDAAAAAKICAALVQHGRGCDTTVFDGQRLAMNEDGIPQAATTKRTQQHRHSATKRTNSEEPPPAKPEPPPTPSTPSTLSSFFGRK